MEMRCPRCGTANQESLEFCMSCGSALGHQGALERPVKARRGRVKNHLALALIVIIVLIATTVTATSIWVGFSKKKTGPTIQLSAVNFYNSTFLIPLEGSVLIQLTLDLTNDGHKNVSVDPNDLVLESNGGESYHYAARIEAYTIIWIVGDPSTDYVGRELPPGKWGTIWIPFEVRTGTLIDSIVWESTLGSISCFASDYINQRLTDYYSTQGTP